ncbi:MAG: protein kinase domain-containing protein [Anaerolineales bacterium]
MTLEMGVILNNRYRIVEVLAQGGMGSVYHALDLHLGIEVAVKENLFATGGYARQFQREGMILAQLRHPNLPRVTDQFIIEGQGQYLVMDFIKGEDLRERIERMVVVPPGEVAAIGAAICDALTHLNSQTPPIVHRDIKPGNVKISPEGAVYLVDFGLAKTLQGSQTTTTGARAMTPGYSPPEQYGTARTDHRSDIFSLGATLYAALTGVIPEDPIARTMEQVGLTPVRERISHISQEFAEAVEKALAIDPDQRYQSSQEFKSALLKAADREGQRAEVFIVSPAPLAKEEKHPSLLTEEAYDSDSEFLLGLDTGSERIPAADPNADASGFFSSLKKGRSKIGCWMIGGISLVLVLIGGLAFFNLMPKNQVEVPTVITPVDAAQAGLAVSSTETIGSPNPSQTNILTATLLLEDESTPEFDEIKTEEGNGSDLGADSTETDLTQLATPGLVQTPLGGGIGQIAFASDQSGSVQIYILDIDNRDIEQITNIPGGACQPDWSPAKDQLVFISPCNINKEAYPGSALFTINLDGTNLTPIPTVPGGDFDPAWSPDGTEIAFTSLRENGQSQIYVYNLDDGLARNLSDSYSVDRQPAWSPEGEKIVFSSERLGVPQIWVMDADGSNQKLVTRSTNYINLHPDLSPNGQNILFTQLIVEGGIPRLAISPFLYEEYEEYRFSQERTPMREGKFSPDGFWIVYEGWQSDSNQNIYLISANGALTEAITTDTGADFDPAWNP